VENKPSGDVYIARGLNTTLSEVESQVQKTKCDRWTLV
jgi:hypothetical protein